MLKAKKARTTAISRNTEVIEFDDLDAETILEDRGVVKVLKDFGFFWYDFLIGDDIIGTTIVLAAMQATHILTNSGTNAWWLLPLAVAALLPINLFRVTKS